MWSMLGSAEIVLDGCGACRNKFLLASPSTCTVPDDELHTLLSIATTFALLATIVDQICQTMRVDRFACYSIATTPLLIAMGS
ncbi:uncharacterized protein PHALS_13584 [Plasmopara halstedii]|uniref:Uncharacterized protein n=1 Tax=Plasmopara halstedii TaxID=4781 RepID=A0A0P1AQH6_PLAHL|nr:uncharacterized protein PHALS_13584 [Plasmopara halstedii]CEG43386.1 hypothetical protein PHALS_13584 [Plasmopara halstedii]|eukprot:XP_024579755.1 hypothetical protein PHALS_13584 [Plasmopara halstedii]